MIDVDPSYRKKTEYTFRTLCRIIGLKPVFYTPNDSCDNSSIVDIFYSAKCPDNFPVWIYHNPEVVSFYKGKKSFEELFFSYYQGVRLPFLFSQYSEIVVLSNYQSAIYQDLISSAFYFLSGWQEYSRELGRGERFNYLDSLQSKGDFCEIPIVDYYAIIMRDCLQRNSLKKSLKPEEPAHFSVALTHDLDYFNYWTEEHLLQVFRYNCHRFFKNPLLALYKLCGHLITKYFFWNPEKFLTNIYQREERYQVKSTTFIMVEPDQEHRQGYWQDSQQKEKLLKIIKGLDVGLHGTSVASYEENELVKQLSVLQENGFSSCGYRNHFLCFNYQNSFQLLEKAGINYDSTLGFSEGFGFRVGTSMPFYPYSLQDDREFQVLEFPLIIMDSALFKKYSYLQARKKVKQLIDLLAEHNLFLTILWHPNRFEIIDYFFCGKLYWEIIRYIKKKNGKIRSLTDYYYSFLSREKNAE